MVHEPLVASDAQKPFTRALAVFLVLLEPASSSLGSRSHGASFLPLEAGL